MTSEEIDNLESGTRLYHKDGKVFIFRAHSAIDGHVWLEIPPMRGMRRYPSTVLEEYHLTND